MLEKINKQKLVVIGNGMAGIRTVETLLERAPDLYDITVFGSEPYGNYNRILLSPVLSGEKSVDDIMLNTEQWYDDNGITLRKGETITMIDRRTCEVVTAEGGARSLRSAADCDRLQPDHAAAAGQGSARRHRLSRHPGRQQHGRSLDQPEERRRDRRRPARS